MQLNMNHFLAAQNINYTSFPVRIDQGSTAAIIYIQVKTTYLLTNNGNSFNLFTTIHDGNFRRHSSMNVTIK